MSSPDIKIVGVDESCVFLDCNEGIAREIHTKYSFRPENYKHTPAYKMGRWNGYIHIFNRQTQRLPKGLVPDLLDWCEESSYSVKLEKEAFAYFSEKIDLDVDSYKLKYVPKDYQLEGVKRALDKKRQIILSPTASGKSMMIHMICRALSGKKVLIVVPTVMLVNQMKGDFAEYNETNTIWDADDYCHQIMSGREKDTDKPIVISTWQSIFRMPQSWFEQYDAILVDEVHGATAESLKGILNKCINATIRLGFTGTLDGSATNEKVLVGHFGPVYTLKKTHELMERGDVANLEIKAIVLKHKNNVPTLPYKDEVDYLVAHEARNKFIVKLASTREGNTLVLFKLVEKHGKVLKKMFDEAGVEAHLVYGGTDNDVRDNVKKIAEQREGVIILASEKIFSTGVSIKRLHNVVFANAGKARIGILQSIGRGLRLFANKSHCTLYDIGDDMRGSKKESNHSLRHFITRLKLYKSEKFSVKVMEIEL